MKRLKVIMICAAITTLYGQLNAQNNTNSPYTRLGLGELAEKVSSSSAAMGGSAIAIRGRQHINMLNPASYSVVDSMTFMLDGAVSLQTMKIYNNQDKFRAKNSSFDYLSMQFRLAKRLGISLGIHQFSNIGYNFSRSEVAKATPGVDADKLKYLKRFSGEGGLREAYIGLGFAPIKNLSVGASISYLWGDFTRNSENIYPQGSMAYSYKSTVNTSVSDYKLNFGMQYTIPFKKIEGITIGAIYSPKKTLKNDIEKITVINQSNIENLSANMNIPTTFGIGLSYKKDYNLTIAADYKMQKWGELGYTINSKEEDFNKTFAETNLFSNSHKISLGTEYIPNIYKRGYLSNIKYRFGVYYNTPYYAIKGKKALDEYGITFGLGLPLPRTRSILNISGQYAHQKANGVNLDSQNIFKVSIGITFNERWFFKRKVD